MVEKKFENNYQEERAKRIAWIKGLGNSESCISLFSKMLEDDEMAKKAHNDAKELMNQYAPKNVLLVGPASTGKQGSPLRGSDILRMITPEMFEMEGSSGVDVEALYEYLK